MSPNGEALGEAPAAGLPALGAEEDEDEAFVALLRGEVNTVNAPGSELLLEELLPGACPDCGEPDPDLSYLDRLLASTPDELCGGLCGAHSRAFLLPAGGLGALPQAPGEPCPVHGLLDPFPPPASSAGGGAAAAPGLAGAAEWGGLRQVPVREEEGPPTGAAEPCTCPAHPEKPARVRWTEELHGCFVCAVDRLGGHQQATPKAIRDLMGKGLTIPQVKSHLQKYRWKQQKLKKKRAKAGAKCPTCKMPASSGPKD